MKQKKGEIARFQGHPEVIKLGSQWLGEEEESESEVEEEEEV